MVRTKLPPHVNGFIDRYGRARYYVRRPGHKNVRLPGLPWSPEFMAAYAETVEGQQPIEIGAKRNPVGSVAATVGLYLGSTAFANLATETQRIRRNILERFREEHGDKRIAGIERKHVQAMVTAKGATPSAACSFLKTLRGMIASAYPRRLDLGSAAKDRRAAAYPAPPGTAGGDRGHAVRPPDVSRYRVRQGACGQRLHHVVPGVLQCRRPCQWHQRARPTQGRLPTTGRGWLLGQGDHGDIRPCVSAGG